MGPELLLALLIPAARAEEAPPDDDAVMIVESESSSTAAERSAQAVTVIDTTAAQRQSADLAAVVARAEGVDVQRTGGLGSEMRFSLEGFTDDQIRFFLDGVPLDLAGFPAGLAGVPVGLIDRIEVYRGVVPLTLGADALGGAVNLISEPPGASSSLSYQGGSFDTHRLSATAGHQDPRTGRFARGAAWLDRAANDYPVQVQVADDAGHIETTTVRRFHDAYRSQGATVELGLAGRGRVDLLSVRGFGSASAREIQNNVVMSVPYGEAWYGVSTLGGSARAQGHAGRWRLDTLGGFTWTARTFSDLGACVYDWFGQCVAARGAPGELTALGADQTVWDRAALARLSARWQPNPAGELTLSLSPTGFTRTGQDRTITAGERDPLTAQRDAVSAVGGLGYRRRALEGRLEEMAFFKVYLQSVHSEEPIPGGGSGRVDRDTARVGLGDGLRVDLGPWLTLKVSYEWATRLPTAEEIFGDGVLVVDNLALRPESSHNTNLGATARGEPRLGALSLTLTGFWREATDLIALLGDDRSYAYENVFGARALGLEGAGAWRSPGDWVSLDASGTWLDLRNTSSEGAFSDYQGDRLPNRPYLMASARLSVGASGVVAAGDRLSLDAYTTYTHGFYRGWESVGFAAFKQAVPSQRSHDLALTYTARSDLRQLSASLEVQDLLNAPLYDFFGVQKPGRAVFGKLSVSRSPREL